MHAHHVWEGVPDASHHVPQNMHKQEQCFKRMRLAAQKLVRHSIGHTMIWGIIVVVGFLAILCDA